MTYFIIGLTFIAWICCLISLKRVASVQSELVKRLDHIRLKWMGNMLFIIPIMIVVIVVLLYLTIWRSNPLLHFSHMIWVLGLWIFATLAFFTFMIPARTKLIYPYLALIVSILSIAIAVFFTPIPSFATIFANQPDLILPMVIGSANLGISWAVIYYIRAHS